MKTHVDTAVVIRAEGTDLFLTRRGQFLPMGAETLFLEEDEDWGVLTSWLSKARRTGVPEVLRVSRVIDLVD